MIVVLLTFLAIVFFLLLLFYSMIRMMYKDKLKWRYMIIVLLSVATILCLGYIKVRYTYIIPFMHFVFQPDDYLSPLIVDEFMFKEKGYSKTYSLPYKYPQIYAIKLSRGENDLLRINGLTGKLKAEFFYKGKLLFEKLSPCMDESMSDTITELIEFVMPLDNKYKSDISVKITVLEPFKELEAFDKPLFIQIGVISN